MATITDDDMRQMLAATRNYSLVILNIGPHRHDEGADSIIWEHGRRNVALRAEGALSVVCPINDGSEVAGVGIFDVSADDVRKIMDEDPAVKAGILTYEVHPCRGFPGSSLPPASAAD